MVRRRPDAEFDFGHNVIKNQRSYKIKAYDFKSASDMKVRLTGMYGDNAMEDPSSLNESEDSMLDQLKEMLNNAGVSDDELKDGFGLSKSGEHKVAAGLGISVEEVPTLINSLVSMLCGTEDDSGEEALMDEGNVSERAMHPTILDEIERDTGTMDFPWRLGSHHGTATAAYKRAENSTKKFYFKVTAVYDASGKELNVKPATMAQIRTQGIDYIGKE